MKSKPSLGVDLVEYEKARAIYERSSHQIQNWLDLAERRFILSKPKPYKAFALLLAAKEAIFKALGETWMGEEGFRLIRVRENRGQFTFCLSGRFGKALKGRDHVLSVVESPSYVVVTCRPYSCVGI